MNYGVYNQAGRIYVDKSYPPLSIGYLAAVLEKEGYDVEALDLVDTSLEDAERILRNKEPQIVGVSCNLTDYRWGSFILAKIAKRIDPNVVVVVGGSHATHMYEQVLTNFPVDIIVRFEGENTFLDVIRTLENGSDLSKVKGIAYKNREGRIIKNPDREPIRDLNSLPFPAHHFFDFKRYIKYSSPLKFKGESVTKLKSANLMASRGCPFNCSYCSITKYWHGKCRVRTATNVVNEMETLCIEHGVTHFNFFDDTFTLNQERVIELCKEIIKRNLPVCWECVTRVDLITSELLGWMKKAGCLSISYGVESGSLHVLKAIKKRYTQAQITKAFRMTHEAGIQAYILLMIGNPGESDQSIGETIELLRIVRPDKIRTTLTMIYPATDLYLKCKERGLINDEYWLTDKAAPVYTAENDIKQLKKWERKIIVSYFLQNRKLVKLLEMMLYRTIFNPIREMIRRVSPKIDKQVEKLDHFLHRL